MVKGEGGRRGGRDGAGGGKALVQQVNKLSSHVTFLAEIMGVES